MARRSTSWVATRAGRIVLIAVLAVLAVGIYALRPVPPPPLPQTPGTWTFDLRPPLASPLPAIGNLLTVLFFMVALLLVSPWLDDLLTCSVAFDSGGLRWRRGLRRGYLAFSRIATANVERGLWGPRLVLAGHDRKRMLTLRTPAPGDDLRHVLQHVAPTCPSPAAAAVGRDGSSVRDWLARLDARARAASAHGAYRDPSLDLVALAEVVADPRADVELRAGAAYVLVASGDGEARTRVASALRSGCPPLVVAMAARASRGGPRVVADAELEDALEFLDEGERAAAVQARRTEDA